MSRISPPQSECGAPHCEALELLDFTALHDEGLARLEG